MNHLHWNVPSSHTTLRQAVESIKRYTDPGMITPFIVRLVEHPDHHWFNGRLFPGACTMEVHDILHCVLGQDLSPRGEAITIGYTMGSTKRMTDFRSMLYRVISRFLYPKHYKFSADETVLFEKSMLVSQLTSMYDLSNIDYTELMDDTLDVVRRKLGIELIHLQHL